MGTELTHDYYEHAVRVADDKQTDLCPIGDIHHNAPGFDRDRFVDSIQWLRETSEKTNRKVIVPLMGDELELLSGSEGGAIERPVCMGARAHGWNNV